MSRLYYFVGTSLPEIQLGVPPDISFEELIALYRQNLSSKDWKQVEIILRLVDLENLRALWLNRYLDVRGNYDANTLQETLLTGGEEVPSYVADFLDKWDKPVDRVSHFAALLSAYFTDESVRAQGFLREYLVFEHSLQLVLVGFRAKKLGRDLSVELQYEDPENEIVAEILAQKDAKNFEPPEAFTDIKPLFEEYENDPIGLKQALDAYRFEKINEMIGLQELSTDRLLGYLIQFLLNERILALDRQKGLSVVRTIVEGVS